MARGEVPTVFPRQHLQTTRYLGSRRKAVRITTSIWGGPRSPWAAIFRYSCLDTLSESGRLKDCRPSTAFFILCGLCGFYTTGCCGVVVPVGRPLFCCPPPAARPRPELQPHRKTHLLQRAVRVSPLLAMVADWPTFLNNALAEEELRELREHGRTGRPLGSSSLSGPLGSRCRSRPPTPERWPPFKAAQIAITRIVSPGCPMLGGLPPHSLVSQISQDEPSCTTSTSRH